MHCETMTLRIELSCRAPSGTRWARVEVFTSPTAEIRVGDTSVVLSAQPVLSMESVLWHDKLVQKLLEGDTLPLGNRQYEFGPAIGPLDQYLALCTS